MATSSSAKKVARLAAKSGGGSNANKQANWLFPVAVVLILVLGIGIVVFARARNGGGNDASIKPRAQLEAGQPFDHWHEAFAVNVCGTELQPVPQVEPDVLGIHTHGDGLIHIHPFSLRAAGKGATMKRFFDQVELKVTNDGFQLPSGFTPIDGGRTVEEGKTKCGGKEGEVVLAHWKSALDAATKPPDEIFTDDFPSIRFEDNYGAYTLAFEPKGTKDIPPPSNSSEIETLGACDGENPPAACQGVTGSTVPGDSSTGTVPATKDTTGDTTPGTTATTAGSGG